MLAADRPDLVRGVVMAAASAGKLPPGSDEMPYGRLRDAIDSAGDARLSGAAPGLPAPRLLCPGHDPSAWLDGWNAQTHEAQGHARRVTPIDDYFSAGTTVPILDLRAEHDAVVIPM